MIVLQSLMPTVANSLCSSLHQKQKKQQHQQQSRIQSATYAVMDHSQMIQRTGSAEKENKGKSSEKHSLLRNGSPSCYSPETYSKMDKFAHGTSRSPRRLYEMQRLCRTVWESPRSKHIVQALLALVGIPLITFGSLFPADSVPNYLIAIWTAWDGLLSISCLVVMACTIPSAFLYARLASSISTRQLFGSLSPSNSTHMYASPPDSPMSSFYVVSPTSVINSDDAMSIGEAIGALGLVDKDCLLEPSLSRFVAKKATKAKNYVFATVAKKATKAKNYVFATKRRLFNTIALANLLIFLILLGLVGPNSLVYPSWWWHPFLWFSYRVYDIKAVGPAMDHICINPNDNLCLSENEWNLLSTGTLSSKNPDDVRAVAAGLSFARENSIVINVLAMNVRESLPALRVNLESLVPLFKNVALVVFENDSTDGTREEIKKWAKEVEGLTYAVDLMECIGHVDCKLARKHRDHYNDDEAYSYSSAIGEMHTYRNLAFDYIKNDAKYSSFSHLMVLDVDLGVSFSPLGILHTLGVKPDNVVASSGRQPWPTAFGSLITPYDLNGFREHNEKNTMGLEIWHNRFCSIMPSGERWWSECDALAPTHLIAILWNDRKIIGDDFYQVDSAFNGAVLYPLDLLRRSSARYDRGESNQRCEHVGLHSKLNELQPMYVDRKWDMHLNPDFPGGAAGQRAKKVSDRIKANPRLLFTVLLTHVVTVGVFVWATFTIGVYAIQPCVSSLLRRRQGPLALPLTTPR